MNILIAGGTGLLGTRLSELLTLAGHAVAHLSRTARAGGPYPAYAWNPAAGQVAAEAIDWADAIVNLAGANVGERWTAAHKRAIVASRVDSGRTLRAALARGGHRVTTFVAVSGTGYYGDTGDRVVDETTPAPPPGTDFLADVCRAWEAEAEAVRALGIRVVILRMGVVLTTRGGALPKLALPVKLGVGAPLGSGRQWVPWVHLDDACRAFSHALTTPALTAVYDVTAPNPVTNADLNRALARVLHRPLWLPPVPALAVRLLVGEMSAAVLGSCRATSARLAATGFRFEYPTLEPALRSCYG